MDRRIGWKLEGQTGAWSMTETKDCLNKAEEENWLPNVSL